jgi:hypothetical protein
VTSNLRIIVTGLIGQHPLLGGMTWHYLQYVLGLARLGQDVFYFEDSGEWPYNLDGGASGDNYVATGCRPNINYLNSVMSHFDLAGRWAYRCPIDGCWHGLSDTKRREVLGSADLLINVSGTLARPGDYRNIHTLVYIDTDPVFTQIKLARRARAFRALVEAHDVHFSFGESLPGILPFSGQNWIPTRQPIVLDQWRPEVSFRRVFTTVMNWASYKSEKFDGLSYGQKDIEFVRFLDLPALIAPSQIEIAVRGTRKGRLPGARNGRRPSDLPLFLRSKGWLIVDATEVCGDFETYRRHIESSMAEWTVAKNAYVQGRSGWFSDRSACYLAAGRPAIVQDTGWGPLLPCGEGLLKFSTLEEAADAIRRVESDYKRHAAAARQIAQQFFDSSGVLGRLLEAAARRQNAEVV